MLNRGSIIPEDAYQLLADGRAIVQHQTAQLQGISYDQEERLVDKPYSAHQNLDYLIAISG